MLESADGGLRLSPAYDIVCSKVVLPRESDCALTLNGKQNKIDRGDFEQFAGTLRIPSKVVSGIFERFSQGYPLMVGELPQSRLLADMQDKVRRIMEERHQRIFGG
jgi:serine/threonine-protein kinase HipA